MIYTYVPKELMASALLTGSAATKYTVPAATSTIIKEITLCNTHTATLTVTVYTIASGGTAGDLNTLFKTMSIQPSETKIIPMNKVLPSASFVQALASTTDKIAMSMSGIEVS